MRSDDHTFTVFTPAYNRAHTLHRVYESLAHQTFRDFEWLIVDDGSTDQTAALVRAWQGIAPFPIRYYLQANRGKHVAFNRGVREARGTLFLTLDSDDACVPTALERLLWHWQSILEEERAGFSGVTALCVDENGQLVGRRFPRDVMDSDSLEMRYRFKVTCEKWGFHRTDVLRQYAFPEDVPGRYVPESIVWCQVARRYKTRFVNETLRIYYTDQPSLMRSGTPGRAVAGARLAQLATLNTDLDYFKYAPLEFCRAAARYVRFSLHTGASLGEQWRQITNAAGRTLWLLALPVGLAIYAHDKWAMPPESAQHPARTT
jgi:glycosyltransferase involved in cell wall biosynthesis